MLSTPWDYKNPGAQRRPLKKGKEITKKAAEPPSDEDISVIQPAKRKKAAMCRLEKGKLNVEEENEAGTEMEGLEEEEGGGDPWDDGEQISLKFAKEKKQSIFA